MCDNRINKSFNKLMSFLISGDIIYTNYKKLMKLVI